jgi:hypothetical protein
MARIRSVHPDLHRDKTIAGITAAAERTFVRLWCHLDDEGRGEDDPELLKADLYPRHREMDAAAIDRDLSELETAGLIIRYQVDGERYLCCKPETWCRYQRPQKKQVSKLPGPDLADPTIDPVPDRSVTATRPLPPVGEGRGEVVVGEGKGQDQTLAPPKATRKPDLIFDALVNVCGLNPDELTKSGRGALNRATAELREIGATPEGITARAKVHRQRWPGAELTPSSLAKNYAQLGVDPSRKIRAVPSPDACVKCKRPLLEHDVELCAILERAG